jgi:hypothetical protein
MQFNFLNYLRGWTGKITHFFLFAVVFFLLSINFGTVEAQEGDLYVASGANHKVVSYNGTRRGHSSATLSLQAPGGLRGLAGLTFKSRSVAIPTMTEGGMIIFIVFAGLVAVYSIKRRRRVEI